MRKLRGGGLCPTTGKENTALRLNGIQARRSVLGQLCPLNLGTGLPLRVSFAICDQGKRLPSITKKKSQSLAQGDWLFFPGSL